MSNSDQTILKDVRVLGHKSLPLSAALLRPHGGELVDNPASDSGVRVLPRSASGATRSVAAHRRSLRRTEEASALPQDPGQTKIRRKLLSQTWLIGESPTCTASWERGINVKDLGKVFFQ